MYKSRNTFCSDGVSISFDVQNGEVLSIFDEKSHDNIIKNHVYNAPNLFCIHHNGGKLTIPAKSVIHKYPQLKPQFIGGEDYCMLRYNKLFDGESIIDIAVDMTIKKTNRGITFEATVENNSDMAISFFEYPCLNGIIIGDDFTANTLVYPFNAGVKLKNPVEYLEKPAAGINWRWQDYQYYYNYDGFSRTADASGFYNFTCPYSGPASLRYIDLYTADHGLFLGLMQTDGITYINARTKGSKCAGMSFSFQKLTEGLQNFSTKPVLLRFHDGDWHSGADIYRGDKVCQKDTPQWFMNASRLTAHYDFQYQNGGIVHTFDDIPTITDEAVACGCRHLLLSGWHTGGFDNGFPDYSPNPLLGGDSGFKAGLDYAHSKGVYVSLYINTRMANTAMSVSDKLIESSAVIQKNGEKIHEHAGNGDIDFVLLCPSSKPWREYFLGKVRHLAHLGIDGVYYDQLAMAAPRPCFDSSHNHQPFDWSEGYIELLKETHTIKANNGERLNIIIEGCSDLYNPYADCMLVSTFSYINSGAFPELYRYTCPEQKLVDMVYPRYKNAMRPEFVSARSTDMINKCFITGMTFWVYDLVEDNTFKHDPEQAEYLKGITKLRDDIADWLNSCAFRDRLWLSNIPTGTDAKLFLGDGRGVILYTQDINGRCDLQVDCEIEVEKIITNNSTYTDKLYLNSGGETFIYIPESSYGAIIFKNKLT